MFLNSTFEIAKNKEFTRLNYPSDLSAGKMLAEKISSLLMLKKEYKDHLDLAKKYYFLKKITSLSYCSN